MSKRVIVRRSVDYGNDRRASSYLIEGANGWRFAKCSTWDATELNPSTAKKLLDNLRRNDPHRKASVYEIVEV